MSDMTRRRLFGLASAFAALAATPSALAGLAPLAPIGDGKGFVRITVHVDERLPAAIHELAELLPLASDCDVRTRSRLVELFEHGNRFFEVLQLEQRSALGAVERTIVLQPSNLLVLCVAALARHGQGSSIHQSHGSSSVGRLATPTLDGRVPGVEPPQMPGRGQSLAVPT